MSPALTLPTIKRRATGVLKTHGIKRAGLFGSAARNQLKPSSDVDILIETGGKMGLIEMVGLKLKLEASLGRKVDLVEFKAVKPTFAKQVARDYVAVI